jgi:GH15 family glucan-1,4-alpha-glucosidase
MATFIDEQTHLPHASYDLWEEKFATHTYTTAVTYKALIVASSFADRFRFEEDYLNWKRSAEWLQAKNDVFYNDERNSYIKSVLLQENNEITFDNTLDVSSWYGMFTFEYETNKQRLVNGAKTIEQELLNSAPSGGVPRYENDNYFASEPKYKGNSWYVTTLWLAQYYVRSNKTEQASELIAWCLQHTSPSGMLSEQAHTETGASTGVSPLVWSHAELINTILDISDI